MKIMKNKLQALLMALMTFGAIHHAAGQGTAFTYQGRLNDSGQCANGQFDLQFELYGSASGGAPLYTSTTITSDVSVTNGLFTVTLDFGSGVFTGATYFLETDVRTNGSTSPYTVLVPRLQVLPTPYAVYAATAGAASGTLTGNGAGITNINASQLTGTVASTQLQGVYGNALIMTNTNNVLAGDGSQLANVNATTVGGQTAASILSGVGEAKAATSANIPGAIVARDTNGNLSAGSINLSGSLNVPFPFIMYEGTNTIMIEEGRLFWGINSGSGSFSSSGGLS